MQKKSALPELNWNVIVASQEIFLDEQDKQIHVICYYLLSIALLIHSYNNSNNSTLSYELEKQILISMNLWEILTTMY